MTTTEPGVRGFTSPFEVPTPEGCEGWESMYPVLRAVQRGAAGVRGGARLVPRRDALPRADVPVRLRDRGLAVHVPRAGELADLRGPAGARDRPPRAVRVGVHERQPGHRPGGDRPAGRAVRPARRVLLPELGRALRALARQGARRRSTSSRRSRSRTCPRSRTRRSSPRAAGSAPPTRCSSPTTGCSRASTGSGSTTSSS